MKTYVKPIVLAAAMLSLSAPLANAVATLRLTSGSTTVTLADGAPGDGVVVFNGFVGGWSLNITTGLTYPAFGSPDKPYMGLESINVLSSDGNPLTIEFSQEGFTGFGGMEATIGGTSTLPVTYSTYYGTALFDESNLLTSMSFMPGAFSGTVNGVVPELPGSYSLTEKVVLNGSRSPQVASIDALLRSVPEGGSTVLMLGASLLGLVGFASLRRRSA
jgi:hypothetical protein